MYLFTKSQVRLMLPICELHFEEVRSSRMNLTFLDTLRYMTPELSFLCHCDLFPLLLLHAHDNSDLGPSQCISVMR